MKATSNNFIAIFSSTVQCKQKNISREILRNFYKLRKKVSKCFYPRDTMREPETLRSSDPRQFGRSDPVLELPGGGGG